MLGEFIIKYGIKMQIVINKATIQCINFITKQK